MAVCYGLKNSDKKWAASAPNVVTFTVTNYHIYTVSKDTFVDYQQDSPLHVDDSVPDFSVAAQASRSIVERLKRESQDFGASDTLPSSLDSMHRILRRFLYRSASGKLQKGAGLSYDEDVNLVIQSSDASKRLDFSIVDRDLTISRAFRGEVDSHKFTVDQYLNGPWKIDLAWVDE